MSGCEKRVMNGIDNSVGRRKPVHGVFVASIAGKPALVSLCGTPTTGNKVLAEVGYWQTRVTCVACTRRLRLKPQLVAYDAEAKAKRDAADAEAKKENA